MAYQSLESGRYEVYVRPFPDVDAGRWQVSSAGGQDPLWSPDGSELFFLEGNRLLAAPVQTDSTFSRGTPQLLFETISPSVEGRMYDIAPDGERFLLITPGAQADGADATVPQIHVVLNWFEELNARVPVP